MSAGWLLGEEGAGKAPPAPPLPSCDDQTLGTIHIYKHNDGSASDEAPAIYDDDVNALIAAVESLPKLTIPETLRNPHPLVEAVRKDYAARKPWNEDEFFRPNQCRRGLVAVSRQNIRRALLLMDTLLKVVVKVGGEVKVDGSQWDQRYHVFFLGESVTAIRLRERHKQEERKPNPKDTWDYRRTTYVPLGLFILDSGPSYDSKYIARETEKHRIEDELNGVLLRWAHDAGRLRIQRRAAEQAARERAAAERRRAEIEAERQHA